ncbi:HAD-like Sugar Phosphate Phosphatase [Pleurotus pulmonarius]|nr:hypothetical protein EYR36_006445 [Pleurotus pulmonarius]KAF4601145.1 hypothetical protein EYR38_005795 [Pleurotus pulmonarius]
MPVATVIVDAVLFDMDGTLLDSTAGVVGAWEKFKETYPGIDIHKILDTAHGVRTVDNLKNYCGLTDPDELEREALRFETAIVETSTNNGRQGIVKLPGVSAIIEELEPALADPQQRWAICTSATRAYATAALGIAGIPVPKVFVAAEDVEKGKPFPDPYLLGAKLCGVEPEKCIVIEDAPSGIRSGKTAGCQTIGLLTTHKLSQVQEAAPDFIVPNLASVSMKRTEDGKVKITITTE